MREIKFRAWDKATKRWIAEGFYILGETTCFDLVARELMKAPLGKTTLERIGDVEIVQYTGLKDKNGKEIYEGDIVKGFSKNLQEWQHKVVIWDTYKWELEPSIGVTLGGEIEIIGNVHLHAHLLTNHPGGHNEKAYGR